MASGVLNQLGNKALVHIIGIGGIGTSAIAQWLGARRLRVEGSDATPSAITRWLTEHHIAVTYDPQYCWNTPPAAVIYSDAVPEKHPLRQLAQEQDIPQLSYAEALGELTAEYDTIAIAGSHGKSTTTSLTGLILEQLGMDPTVVVGTTVPAWKNERQLGNFRLGQGKICVVEADEYRNHFHYLRPTVVVITSVDHDHFDAFPTKEAYEQAFVHFLSRLAPAGKVVTEASVYQALKHYGSWHGRSGSIYTLGSSPVKSDWPIIRGTPVKVHNQQQRFIVAYGDQSWGEFSLRVPGQHMVSNAIAAMAAAFSVQPEIATVQAATRQVLRTFQGTWRRFELLGQWHGVPITSDYAHHPTEVAALIEASHQWYPERRLILILQPHHHNRAKMLAADFKNVLHQKLRSTDQLVLTEVYDVIGREVTGREQDQEKEKTSTWVAEIGAKARHVAQLDQLPDLLAQTVKSNDVVVFAGAGSIDTIARQLVGGG